LNRSGKWSTMLLSTIHHAIEPQKIPPTRNTVNHHCLGSPMPSAARMATNDSTVAGFEGQEKCRPQIRVRAPAVLPLRVQRLGPHEEVRDAVNDQQNTAEQANPELFPYDELDGECAETRDTTVKHIGRRRSKAGDHARPPSCLECPVNAQCSRSHGHRNHQPDDYAPYQQLDFSHPRLSPHMFPHF